MVGVTVVISVLSFLPVARGLDIQVPGKPTCLLYDIPLGSCFGSPSTQELLEQKAAAVLMATGGDPDQYE